MREVCSFSCLPVLPGPAWDLLSKICILLSRSLYTYENVLVTGFNTTYRTVQSTPLSAGRGLPSYPMCQFSRAFAMAIWLTWKEGRRVELLGFTMKSNFRRPHSAADLITITRSLSFLQLSNREGNCNCYSIIHGRGFLLLASQQCNFSLQELM